METTETNTNWNWNEGNAAEQPVETREYAGFWIRFVAVIIDGIVLQIVFSILNVMLGYNAMEPPTAVSSLESVLSCIYYVAMTVALGQTLGKMAVGIKVIRDDGSQNGVLRMILREVVGKFVSGIILCIGFMMAGWDREKRALHDMIAGTRVVKVIKR